MHRLVTWFILVLIVAGDVSHLYGVENPTSGRFLPTVSRELEHVSPSQIYRDGFSGKNIQILHQDHESEVDGNYYWSFSTANGIAAEEAAKVADISGNDVAKSVTGSYQYISPEGIPVFVSYTADENGFQPHVITNSGQTYGVRGPQEYYRSIVNKEY